MPGPLSFDECMARSWPGITDKEAFCAAMCRGELQKRSQNIDTDVTLEIQKLDTDQRIAYGWVSILEDANGNPIADSERHIIPIEDLQKAVHSAFAESGGRGKGGDLHERQGLIDVVEMAIVTQELRKAEDSPFDAEGPSGWWAGFRVGDDDVWSKIKSGDRPELSLRATGRGVPLKKQWTNLTKSDEPILITDIELNKLEWFSTVDRGASGDDAHRPRIVLWKRAQLKKQETTMTIEEALATIADEEVKAAIMEALKAAAAPAAPAPPAPPAPPMPIAQRDDVPEDVKMELKKREEEDKKREDERIKLEKQAEADRKRIVVLEDKNDRIEIAKRVTSTMKFIPGDHDSLVDLIKRIKDTVDDDAAKKFEERLVSLSKAMEESALLKGVKEFGTSAVDVNDNSATVELQKRAEELRKVNPELSIQSARQRVMVDKPELYQRALEEQKNAS